MKYRIYPVFLALMLFTMNGFASSWLECTGAITLEAVYQNNHDNTPLPSSSDKEMTADIFVHEDSFTCKGHGEKINTTGLVNKAKLLLPALTEFAPSQGQHYYVSYSYEDGMTPTGVVSNTTWQLVHEVQSVSQLKPAQIQDQKTSPVIRQADIDLPAKEVLNWDHANQPALVKEGRKTYAGNYFSIHYPQDFSAKPIAPIGRYDGNEYANRDRAENKQLPADYKEYIETDEAFFASADGLVEFFVYSPLWTGKPKDYLIVQPNETLADRTSEKISKENNYRNYVMIAFATIEDKKGAYARSYVHKRACHADDKSSFNDCVSSVFGIKYKDKKAYNQYRDAYTEFKKSLQQYAD